MFDREKSGDWFGKNNPDQKQKEGEISNIFGDDQEKFFNRSKVIVTVEFADIQKRGSSYNSADNNTDIYKGSNRRQLSVLRRPEQPAHQHVKEVRKNAGSSAPDKNNDCV